MTDKAFDRVSHPKLIHRLKALGIHDKVVSWVREFLSGRTYQVCVNGTFSNVYSLHSGVPQGGVLSPTLFNIYVAELEDLFLKEGVTSVQYADDLKIYREVSSARDTDAIQSAIDKLYMFSVTWQLPLALQKTYHLRIGSSELPCSYSVSGQPISRVNEIKDLGFSYTEKLDFSPHIKAICRKASVRIFHIFKALTTRDKEVLLKAYKVYVRPLVESSCSVFSPAKQKDVLMIEKIQNNFTRKILLRNGGFLYGRIPRASIRNAYLGIPSLKSRRYYFDIVMVYKLINHLIPVSCTKFYTLRPSVTRGGTDKLFFKSPKTSLRATFFTVRAGLRYLKWSKTRTVPTSLPSFKRMAKATIFSAK